MPFEKVVLANGLTLVVENVPGSSDAVILLGTRKGGAIYSPGGFHFIEHLLTKKGGARTAREFSECLGKIGVDFNAQTSHISMTITGRFKPDLLPAVLKIFSKISSQSFISERDFEIEKGVILVERKMIKDHADGFSEELLYKFLFDGHPIAQPIVGTESEITNLCFGDLTDIVKNYFSPSNLILVIVGPNEISEVSALVVENFSGLKKRRFSCPKVKRIKIKAATPAVSIRKKIISAAYLAWAFPAPAFSSKDYISMLVLTNILQERLFNELRNKRGLCYNVGSCYFDSPVVNLITLSVDCLAEKVQIVSEIVGRELNKLRRTGIPETEFYETLKGLIMRVELMACNSSERAEYLYKSMIVGSLGSFDDILARLRQETFTSMKPLVRRFLRPSLVKQVILTPPVKKRLTQSSSNKA